MQGTNHSEHCAGPGGGGGRGGLVEWWGEGMGKGACGTFRSSPLIIEARGVLLHFATTRLYD